MPVDPGVEVDPKRPIADLHVDPAAVAAVAPPISQPPGAARRGEWFADTADEPVAAVAATLKAAATADTSSGATALSAPLPEAVEAPQRTTAASESQSPSVEGATVIEVDFIKGRAAPGSELVDVPQAWREGCARIRSMPPPRGFTPERGFTHERWRSIGEAAAEVVGRWGAEMARLGWSDFDLFAVHSDAPATRLDAMGLVSLMGPCQIVAIDARGADLRTPSGAVQRFQRRPLPTGTTLLWHLLPDATTQRPRFRGANKQPTAFASEYI